MPTSHSGRPGTLAALISGALVLMLGCSDSTSKRNAAEPQPPPEVGGDASGQGTCSGTAYSAYVSDPKLCVTVFSTGLKTPRQFAFAHNGDLFVNEGAVTVLWDANGDGKSDANERASFAKQGDLFHGLAFDRDERFVYAASTTDVYRWTYKSGQRQAQGAAEHVVTGIPSGGHSTRTLAFDAKGRLYVSVGSGSNVDVSEEQWQTRSMIRRYDPAAGIPAGGFAYTDGEVVASGMRNEVGLYFDSEDRLWGVENGRDDLQDADLGGDIHNDNPGEEINLVDGEGTSFYGYPFCFSEFKAQGGRGPATQWADQTLNESIRKTDAWCQDTANVRPPMFSMQAHYAPLAITQYRGSLLPFKSDFIITAHGSWDRRPAVGRLLLRAHYDGSKIISVEPIVGKKGSGGALEEGNWDARPVDVQQGPDEALYFTDDMGGRIFKVGSR